MIQQQKLNILEKCCILEKSRTNLVKFGENSAKFWQICEILEKKQKNIAHFEYFRKMLHFGKIPKKLVKFGENLEKFSQNLRNFGKKTAKNSAIFNENFEIRERCKGVHCVDLGESFPTSIYLQNLASIQPRTSPLKFR